MGTVVLVQSVRLIASRICLACRMHSLKGLVSKYLHDLWVKLPPLHTSITCTSNEMIDGWKAVKF